jgi:hypothetical protein
MNWIGACRCGRKDFPRAARLQACTVEWLQCQSVDIHSRDATQVDRCDRAAIRHGTEGECLGPADVAHPMIDLTPVEPIAQIASSPPVSLNDARGKKANSNPFRRQCEQLQLVASFGASASTVNVTLPQWQLPSKAMRHLRFWGATVPGRQHGSRRDRVTPGVGQRAHLRPRRCDVLRCGSRAQDRRAAV